MLIVCLLRQTENKILEQVEIMSFENMIRLHHVQKFQATG